MKRHGVVDTRAPFSAKQFDEGYQSLIAHDRAYGGEVYDAVKQIPAFIRLLADPRHEMLFQLLRPHSIPGVAAGGYGIRIDNPSEDRFRAEWHQDYPAQLRSLDGLVFWSPLVQITAELGPVQFCRGSHADGAVPVLTKGKHGSDRHGAYALHLKDEASLLDRYEKLAPLTSPGDLIVVDFLTLHASGFNRSNRSRWSLQFRYFNFDEPTGLAHGWKGSFAAGVDFKLIHPELCADLDY
ncbi:phytanoyl-CoA dioxygenase family protein [Dyella tabacisoli]